MRHITAAGLSLIKQFEGLRLAAYMPTPHDVPTIGYGHTKGVQMGWTCTEAEADAWLREDCEWAERCVEKAVTVPLTDAEFDALVSFTFNIGCAGFQKSTVLRLVNEQSENEDLIRQAFGLWNRQAHKELAGLTKRRAAEADTFLA